MFKESDRVIFTNWETDSAVILIPKPDFPFPEKIIDLFPTTDVIKLGSEVGWLGFPSIEPFTLCFFAGCISARRNNTYLIDGVSINGVSGGPVLYVPDATNIQIIGIISFYRANRLPGDTLPGLVYFILSNTP